MSYGFFTFKHGDFPVLNNKKVITAEWTETDTDDTVKLFMFPNVETPSINHRKCSHHVRRTATR